MSDVAGLLAALAAGMPALAGANCVGSHELFDPADPWEAPESAHYRHQAAVKLCGGCVCREECGEWLASLPRIRRPGGVVAGRVVSSGLRGRKLVPASEVLAG